MPDSDRLAITYLFSRECPSHEEGLSLLAAAAADAAAPGRPDDNSGVAVVATLRVLDVSGSSVLLDWLNASGVALDVTFVNWPEHDIMALPRAWRGQFDVVLADQVRREGWPGALRELVAPVTSGSRQDDVMMIVGGCKNDVNVLSGCHDEVRTVGMTSG